MITARSILVCLLLVAPCAAETLTLPAEKRPAWLRRDGIVMAGSWEPLLFRVRRDGGQGYTPTREQMEAYQREQSPEMIARLKELGVNFVMMHCYKGGGLQAERESMADAVRFARLCQEAGLRVGVYNYSGAFIWELMFKEVPQAGDWVVLNPEGKPTTYGSAGYRYYWNRNHPDARAYYQKIVRFAVEEIRADLIHFDNYHIGPGRDANSIERFRHYLRTTLKPSSLAEHRIDPATALPPTSNAAGLLARAWADFSCQSIADSYHDMSQYARSLRPDILMECNPHGVQPGIRPPIDHGRLLQGGEAYWDESGRPGYSNNQLRSRIRTCKVARSMENIAFAYTTSPLEAAESMAFNRDSLGAICWFENAQLVRRPGAKERMSPELLPYVRFFHDRRELLRDARVVADVAVLRSFPSLAFGPPEATRLTGALEDALILNRSAFQLLHEHQLPEAGRYKVLALAGCAALSDQTIEAIRRYVAGGGRVCVVGPLATHDEWMLPRQKPALADLPESAVVTAERIEDALAAIDRACNHRPTITTDAPPGLCLELTELPKRQMVHLVNYREDGPVARVRVTLRLPAGKRASSVTLVSPEHRDITIPFRQIGEEVQFLTPPVNVYEIAEVRW